MNFYRIKRQLNKTPIVPMQQESFDNILGKVRDVYRDVPMMNQVKEEFFVDTKDMYYQAMQQTILENTIVTPQVKGLENERMSRTQKEPE